MQRNKSIHKTLDLQNVQENESLDFVMPYESVTTDSGYVKHFTKKSLWTFRLVFQLLSSFDTTISCIIQNVP